MIIEVMCLAIPYLEWVVENVFCHNYRGRARGRVKDFGDNGAINILALDYFIEAVNVSIFSAAIRHAAINFPKLSVM